MKKYGLMMLAGLIVVGSVGVAQAQVPYVFQQGVGGYAGTSETFLMTGDAAAVNGELTEWEWDGSDAGGYNIGLLRFDNVFGTAPGQVPPTAKIIKATLTLNVTNEGDAAQTATMHELMIPFQEDFDMISFGDGFEPIAGTDYEETALLSIPGPSAGTVLELDVTSSILKAFGGATFHGWIFIPGGSNGVGIASSEAAANQPKLTILVEGTSPPEASRTISDDLFTGGATLDVSILVTVKEGSQSVKIVETLPNGWTASGISDGGTFANGAITWNLSGVSGSKTLTYKAQAPASPTGDASFSGSINDSFFVSGSNQSSLVKPAAVGEFESHQDIGAVSAAGDASFAGSMYTVRGSGADIWDAADEFHYLFKRMTGSFKVTAKLGGFNDTGANEWSKVGVMVRDNLTAGSPHFFVMTRASDGQFDTQWRAAQGGSSSNTTLRTTSEQDGQVQLVKVGNTFQAYYFNIQTNEWTLQTTQNIEMTGEVLLGLAVTSHEDGNHAVGEFENLQIELYPYDVTRSFPVNRFQGGKSLSGVKLTTNVREGQTANFTLTETLPTGWTASNVQASAGTATANANGTITWTLSNGTGQPTLTYDALAPGDATTANWSGSSVSGTNTFLTAGPNQLNAIPPLFKTNNVLAVGIWNDGNTSSDLAATAELVDNNGVIYAQDSAATGGWPAGSVFRFKVVFFEDGSGEEEPGWQQRSFNDSSWELADTGFTIGYGGNAAENGETVIVTSEETVYTRTTFAAQSYDTINEITIRIAADDEALVWLNGVYIGNTAAGTSDRGERAPDYVFDTTIAGGQGGLENGSNPSTYTGAGTKVFTFAVNLVEGQPTSVQEWSVY